MQAVFTQPELVFQILQGDDSTQKAASRVCKELYQTIKRCFSHVVSPFYNQNQHFLDIYENPEWIAHLSIHSDWKDEQTFPYKSFNDLFTKCIHLKSLELIGGLHFSITAEFSTTHISSSVQSLRFYNCNVKLAQALTSFPNLTSLEWEHCTQLFLYRLSGDDLDAITRLNLVTLIIKGRISLTPKNTEKLIEACLNNQSLKKLILPKCKNLDNKQVQRLYKGLQDRCSTLKIGLFLHPRFPKKRILSQVQLNYRRVKKLGRAVTAKQLSRFHAENTASSVTTLSMLPYESSLSMCLEILKTSFLNLTTLKIRRLNLTNCPTIGEFNHIKKLSIKLSKGSCMELVGFLNHFPKLEKCQLINTKKLFSNWCGELKFGPSLRVLKIENGGTGFNHTYFLKSCYNLRVFQLFSTFFAEHYLTQIPRSWPFLEDLRLINDILYDPKLITGMVTQLKQLKVLQVSTLSL